MSAQSGPTSDESRSGWGPARQALADAARDLAAAAPDSLDAIGKRMRPPRSRQRLSEWQKGQRLPQLGDLEALLRACAPANLAEHELRRLWARLHRLHAAAQ